MEEAFTADYNPALKLASISNETSAPYKDHVSADELVRDVGDHWTKHLRREEQELIDRIIQGREVGAYFIFLGPKVRWHMVATYT